MSIDVVSEEEMRGLILNHGGETRRRIMAHFKRVDYASHAARILHLRSATVKAHIKDLKNAGLVIEVCQKKRKDWDQPRTGGHTGVAYTFYELTEKGAQVLEVLAEPYEPPVYPQRQVQGRKFGDPI